jgi:MGT family glycosyltransferase
MHEQQVSDEQSSTQSCSMNEKTITVLFVPEAAFGPTNQCIGIGAVLRQRGHRVVFAVESSWKGKLAVFGFDEYIVEYSEPMPTNDKTVDVSNFWVDYICANRSKFGKPTIEQIESFLLPTWQTIVDGARFAQSRLREIIIAVEPDVIVEDNVICFPALVTAGVPFVRIVSCNPLEITGPNIPPVLSGLPTGDRSQWAIFRAEYERVLHPLWMSFNKWVVEQGATSLDYLQFIHTSSTANLYVFPEEADYVDVRPLDTIWHRMDSSVRETDTEYVLSASMRNRPDGSALIYFSLGSIGGADVELMRRLISVLAKTSHRYIVSKGPMQEQIELAPNMVGAQMLPQTRIIPQVDLVITHGGNNTTTESLHFGKPMILLPFCWDGYDNAQRMHELGFGIRLQTYTFRDEELMNAIDTLLADTALRARMAAVGERIRARNGLRRGADVIEAAGRQHATIKSSLKQRNDRNCVTHSDT